MQRVALAILLGIMPLEAFTQNAPATSAPVAPVEKAPLKGVELDRVVAVVNGDLILNSDVDEDRRLMAFQPFRQAAASSRENTINRLIDRMLILQQFNLENEDPITDEQVEEEFAVLRKEIPACKTYHCETDAGWQKYVAAQGFTVSELTEIWRQRMQILQFVELRFRLGTIIKERGDKGVLRKDIAAGVCSPACDGSEAGDDLQADRGHSAAAADGLFDVGVVEDIARARDGAGDAAGRGGSVSEMQPGREPEVQPGETKGAPVAGGGGSSKPGKVVMWVVVGLIALVVVLAGAFAWYSTTDDFQQRANREIVTVLGDATGGRVELAGFRFSLWHLAIEANGLVIHGLEGPGEAPYLAADRIQIHVKLFNFFSHVTGAGLASHVALSYLRVDHPQFHLIIDKDGKTNQPVPKHPTKSNKPVTDTLLDLKAQTVVLANGVVLLNNRAIPFDLAAHDLQAEVHYIAHGDMYGATIDLNDLRTRMAKEPEAQSSLHLAAQVGRDKLELTKFEFRSGKASQLEATANLANFAKPEWQAKVTGSLELPQIKVLTGAEGLDAGSIDLELNGHNCKTTPAAAQKHPHFWERRPLKKGEKPSSSVLPPDPDCVAGYLLVGKAKIHNASYQNEYVRLHGINGGGDLHVTPTELLLTALTGTLPDGGGASGKLRIVNWLGEAPANAPERSPTTKAAVTTANRSAETIGAKPPVTEKTTSPPVQPAHAYLDATVDRIPLRTIMDVTAPKNYGDLGFDTSITGPVQVEWGGSTADIADTVQVEATLRFAPVGLRRRGALSDIPVTGMVHGHYDGKPEVVRIEQLTLQTPQSNLEASGILGVNVGDPLTSLRVDLQVHELEEYDQLLQTLGLEVNGKKGSAAIPVVLHGALEFNGMARGAIADLNLKGHLQATDTEVKLGSVMDSMIDSVVADAEFSPNSGLAIASSTIKHGTAVLHVEGTFEPRKTGMGRNLPIYAWDEGSAVDARVQLGDAQVTDLLQLAGQPSVPVTGTIGVNAHASGKVKDLVGSGEVALRNGVAYGEPFESLVSQMTVQGMDIEASHVMLKLHGMQIVGSGGYDFTSGHLHGHVEGDKLQLSKFKFVQQSNTNVDGILSLFADADGTIKEPQLKANAKLANVLLDGQAAGEMAANLHSEGNTLYVTADSTVVGAKVNVAGQAGLSGDFPMQAKMTFTGLDVNKLLAIYAPGKVVATSSIGGVVTVSGPLRTPKLLNGLAELNEFDMKLQGVELRTAGPMRVSLQQGIARLEQVHITGQDTDMHASGTAQVLGVTDAKGGSLDVNANGSVSMALLHTFNTDIVSSGKVEFTVRAGGRVMDPALTGTVKFDNVSASD